MAWDDGLGLDCWPTSALAASDLVQLKFEGGEYIAIHRSVLKRLPSFAQSDARIFDVTHITKDAGLVLVQYLYTRTCATTAAVAAVSDAETSRKLFQISLETYAAVIRFSPQGLNELVRENLVRLISKLTNTEMAALLEQHYPPPTRTDEWLKQFALRVLKLEYPTLSAYIRHWRNLCENSDAKTMSSTTVNFPTRILDLMLELDEDGTKVDSGEPPKKRKIDALSHETSDQSVHGGS